MEKNVRLIPIREIKSNLQKLAIDKVSPHSESTKTKTLLKVKNLTKTFYTRKSSFFGKNNDSMIKAIDDVSFDIEKGTCVGLVGESGCGKTTTSKIIMRALSADFGSVFFNDEEDEVDILKLKKRKDLLNYRRKSQYIFQDPYSSLNPRMTVYDIINEPLAIHNVGTEEERQSLVRQLMDIVGLPLKHLRRYPHSFSGGQRQRIGIARALALQPKFIICDEPVSALDVSIQAQVLNLLKDLKHDLGLTYLFISHNLAVVDYIADHIVVMCAGRVVETAPRSIFFNNAKHPYTISLLGAVPEPNPNNKLNFKSLLEGRASEPTNWPNPYKINLDQKSKMIDLGNKHWVRVNENSSSLEN